MDWYVETLEEPRIVYSFPAPKPNSPTALVSLNCFSNEREKHIAYTLYSCSYNTHHSSPARTTSWLVLPSSPPEASYHPSAQAPFACVVWFRMRHMFESKAKYLRDRDVIPSFVVSAATLSPNHPLAELYLHHNTRTV